jgi:formate dehydrogenase-N alpha subunit
VGSGYDVIKYFNMMDKGNVTGYICQGFNPVASFPDKNKVVRSLSKLKYMVVIDPLVTETSTFWQNHGESNDVDPASIQTEVFRLPSTCFAEEDGSIANSGRWLQWHWKGQDAPGEARNDGEILAGIYHRLREMYRTEGGKGAEPLLKCAGTTSSRIVQNRKKWRKRTTALRWRISTMPTAPAGEERPAAEQLRAAAR